MRATVIEKAFENVLAIVVVDLLGNTERGWNIVAGFFQLTNNGIIIVTWAEKWRWYLLAKEGFGIVLDMVVVETEVEIAIVVLV